MLGMVGMVVLYLSTYVCVYMYILFIAVCNHHMWIMYNAVQHYTICIPVHVYALWTSGLIMLHCTQCCMEISSYLLHFNQQVETTTDEDPDSDSPTPATPLYPQLVENCCASSVFVHGELEYEYPSLSGCPLHQDVSPHTHNWHCVVSGRTIK